MLHRSAAEIGAICRRTPIVAARRVWQHKTMATRTKRAARLADPTRLKAFDEADAELVTVIIETPKGSRNKYAFDPEERIFALKKVLPAGMAFPYDFGFVPSTKGGDGDPLDVLVLMDEPAFAGCKLSCRVVGVIEGEQGDKKQTERNDRVVAVEDGNHSYSHVKRFDSRAVHCRLRSSLTRLLVKHNPARGLKSYTGFALYSLSSLKTWGESGVNLAS
jgi:inorganic pyrophosphatase